MAHIPDPTPRQLARFRELVAPANEHGCMEWQGARDKRYGYGRYAIGTRDQHRTIEPHRLALFLHLGRQLDGFALHSCDNPPCCNPEHLREGTQAENVQDAVKRGRHPNPYPPGSTQPPHVQALLRRTREARLAQKRQAADVILAAGEKPCTACGKTLPLDAFSLCKKSAYIGRLPQCKRCKCAATAAWRARRMAGAR